MPSSSLGWGHNPFGNHQFGFGDWAEEMLWKNMPEVYRDCDGAGPTGSVVDQPLRKFQNALKPSYQEIRTKWHQFPSLWDAIAVPIDQLPQLGYNVGITVDPTKPEGLQRSSVLNASQLWVNKGTDKGYQLTAAFEGLLVTITPLWAQTCGPSTRLLGSIGSVPGSFDLGTTLLVPRPVGPGTLHIEVTTEFGTVEDIRDDEWGLLVGSGNRLNGALTRLNITSTVTLTVNSIVGVFNAGDIVVQPPLPAPSTATGVVVAWSGNEITVVTTSGVFGAGGIEDTTSGATATALVTDVDVFLRGETIEGLSSGATAVMRDFNTNYVLVDRVTTLAGFTPGETITGRTSGSFAIAGTAAVLVQGPLRPRFDITPIAGTFLVGDELTGGTSSAVGIVRSIDGASLWVDTITLPGFTAGEIISSGAKSATLDTVDYGTIDYISGLMSGRTVSLAAGSTVNAVVDLFGTGATQFLPAFDEVLADVISLDDVRSDRYTRWPITYMPVRIRNGILTTGECRSYSLRLYFYTPDNTGIENFVDVANRIQLALEQFRPLHVRFDKISFDGARASSQVWRSGRITADSAAASVWTANVVGNQLASSQVWTAESVSATVAT